MLTPVVVVEQHRGRLPEATDAKFSGNRDAEGNGLLRNDHP
jgi:hypothetical protein